VGPRFLIDENLSTLLARHLRTAHRFDAVHVQELGLRSASDADILARAIAAGQVVHGTAAFCHAAAGRAASVAAARLALHCSGYAADYA
jgi:hypothetical protein